MVERLKTAIEKARQIREQADQRPYGPGVAPAAVPGAGTGDAAVPATQDAVTALWQRLEEVVPSEPRLRRERIVTHTKSDLAHVSFDHLRTRILKTLSSNGWTRVGITSPTKGCGKTFVAANLALTLARQPDLRTILMDMDLKAPSLADRLGLRDQRRLAWLLTQDAELEAHMLRIGQNLALGINTERVRNSAELLMERRTSDVLASMIARLRPDVVVYDLPPMLQTDDTIAFLPNLDCVLVVAAAGQTRPDQIDACEQLLEGNSHFLGVLLNKSPAPSEDTYGYGYA